MLEAWLHGEQGSSPSEDPVPRNAPSGLMSKAVTGELWALAAWRKAISPWAACKPCSDQITDHCQLW